MLYREIITVCSEIHTKHINTLCGQNVGFVNVKPSRTWIKRFVVKLKDVSRLTDSPLQYSTVRDSLLFTYYTYIGQNKHHDTTQCTAYPKVLIVTQPVKKIPDLWKLTSVTTFTKVDDANLCFTKILYVFKAF